MMLRRLSNRFFTELDSLECIAAGLAQEREGALRRLLAGQGAARRSAEAPSWDDFLWSDQEYRAAIGRLARFCRSIRERVQAECQANRQHARA
jgi:hypothetical protein